MLALKMTRGYWPLWMMRWPKPTRRQARATLRAVFAHELPDSVDLSRLIADRDLKAVLFPHLREWAGGDPELRRIIDWWEQNFDGSDRIGDKGFDRKRVQLVRYAARGFLLKLEREGQPHAQTGRGMVS